MKSRKKASGRISIKSKRRPELVGPPAPVYEFVMAQLVLRGSGFKSSELRTIIKEEKNNPKVSSVHLGVIRSGPNGTNQHSIGIGTINLALAKVRLAWSRWLAIAGDSIVKNFDEWQKRSVVYSEMERILVSLEQAGFVIQDAPLADSFDITGTVH